MTLSKLKFKDKLIQKGIQTNEQLKRLQALQKELSEWDQDQIDPTSVHGVAKQLLDKSLLLHKDKHIKALVAASFVDILRICAPDAPYTLPELKDIFAFIFRQVAHLWKPPKDKKQNDVQCYQEYYYILRTMADVSCVVLVCDLPNADDIINDVFKDFLSGIRPDTSPRLQGFMADILSQLIDESNSISTDIIEAMLIAFSDKTAKINPAKHKLVVEVCNRTSERLQKSVCQYFNEILLKVLDEEYSEQTFDEVIGAHKIIRSIHRHSPRILLSTIPQIEAELLSENNDLRDVATRTLGRMLGEPTSDNAYSSLAKEHPNTFRAWIDRRRDMSPSIRAVIVEHAPSIVLTHPQLSNEIIITVSDKLRDFDDKVRATACQFFQEITYEVALTYTSRSTLDELALRCKDKKVVVRQEAFESLARMYSLAYADINLGNEDASEKFGWIPRAILAPLHISFPAQAASIKLQVERTLVKYILPLNADSEVAWVDRFLKVYEVLSDDEKKALLTLTGICNSAQRLYTIRYVESCEEFNNDRDDKEKKERILSYIKLVSTLFPEDSKASTDLQEFVKLNETRLYKTLKTAMDPQQCDFKTLQKCQAELHRRLEQTAGNNKTLPSTFDALLLKSTYQFVNKSSIPHLLKKYANGSLSAHSVLLAIAKFTPLMFKNHISELVKQINDERSAVVALRSLAAIAKADKGSIPTEKRFTDRLIRFASQGSHEEIKFATRILSYVDSAQETLKDITQTTVNDLSLTDEEGLMQRMSFLAEVAKSSSEIVQDQVEAVYEFISNDLMQRPHNSVDPDVDVDMEWIDEEDKIDALTFAKVDALRLCTYFTKMKNDNPDQGVEMANSMGQLFSKVLRKKGDVLTLSEEEEMDSDVKNEDEEVYQLPAFVRSRLRLRALVSLLKMAQDEKLEKEVIRPKFLSMSVGVQDVAYSVRRIYLDKLVKYLARFKIPYHYNVYVFLTAHEPVPDITTSSHIYVQSMLRRQPPKVRLNAFEMIFYRLLHTLAHHPDFSSHPADIEATSKYINFYLEMVATVENISLLYYLAGRLKTVRDITTKDNSINLYILSELGQHLTSTLANQRKWTLAAYEGKVKLATDIFKPLPSSEVQREISQKVYLTEEMMSSLNSAKNKPIQRKKKLTESGNTTKKPAKRARRKHNWENEDSDKDSNESGSDIALTDDDTKEKRRGPTRKARPNGKRIHDSDEDEEEEENDENMSVDSVAA